MTRERGRGGARKGERDRSSLCQRDPVDLWREARPDAAYHLNPQRCQLCPRNRYIRWALRSPDPGHASHVSTRRPETRRSGPPTTWKGQLWFVLQPLQGLVPSRQPRRDRAQELDSLGGGDAGSKFHTKNWSDSKPCPSPLQVRYLNFFQRCPRRSRQRASLRFINPPLRLLLQPFSV